MEKILKLLSRSFITFGIYLKCWTQEQIADELKIDRKTVIEILKKMSENCTNAKIGHDFEPFIYNKGIYSRL